MSLKFKYQLGSAVDPGTGLTVNSPRMLPAPPPKDPSHIEYQYLFRRDGQYLYGLGLFGTDITMDVTGIKERVFTFNLGDDSALKSVLHLKRILGDHDDDFSFLKELAHGLLMVSQSDTTHNYDVRYIALTKLAVLAGFEISVPSDIKQLNADEVVLDEIFVPACTSGSEAS